MSDFKNYRWRKMAKMAMANLPFSFVKFAILPLEFSPSPKNNNMSRKVVKKALFQDKFDKFLIGEK